jgi:hypothetical protein
MVNRALRAFLALPLLALPLHAAPSDSVARFLGKWKLDPAHSILIDQMKVEAAGPNKYNLIFSGDNVETVVADGTDQPCLFETTCAIHVQDAHNWKMTRKKDGKIMISALWQLSADGNTLTDNYTGYRPDGTTMNLHYIYQRIAGTSGFAGTWESTSEEMNSTYELEIKPYEGDGLSFTQGGGRVTQNLRFDGKDYAGSGADAPAGFASSGRVMSDRAVERVDKVNGKTFYTQQIELSADGKILTMTIHVPGREKPDVMVFNRE